MDRPSLSEIRTVVSDRRTIAHPRDAISRTCAWHAALYAEAGAPESWLVDISGDELQVEVHTQPTPQGYRSVEILRDDTLRPTSLALELPISEIPWTRS